METTKKLKTIAAIIVSILLILLLILSLTQSHSKTFFIIVGIDSTAILAILIWVLLHHYSTHNPTTPTPLEAGEELRLEYSTLRKAAGLPAKFRYANIEAATDGFQSLIGRGSSGSVFKGILDDGTAVAVKRIEGGEYADRAFRAEVAAVGSVQHVSLVRLLGYCLVTGGGARFLVYEFMSNGSLDKWIFPASGGDRQRPALANVKTGLRASKLQSKLTYPADLGSSSTTTMDPYPNLQEIPIKAPRIEGRRPPGSSPTKSKEFLILHRHQEASIVSITVISTVAVHHRHRHPRSPLPLLILPFKDGIRKPSLKASSSHHIPSHIILSHIIIYRF